MALDVCLFRKMYKRNNAVKAILVDDYDGKSFPAERQTMIADLMSTIDFDENLLIMHDDDLLPPTFATLLTTTTAEEESSPPPAFV